MNLICQICGKTRIMSMPSHLRQAHKMTVSEYKDKFPSEKFDRNEFVYTKGFNGSTWITAKRVKIPGEMARTY